MPHPCLRRYSKFSASGCLTSAWHLSAGVRLRRSVTEIGGLDSVSQKSVCLATNETILELARVREDGLFQVRVQKVAGCRHK